MYTFHIHVNRNRGISFLHHLAGIQFLAIALHYKTYRTFINFTLGSRDPNKTFGFLRFTVKELRSVHQRNSNQILIFHINFRIGDSYLCPESQGILPKVYLQNAVRMRAYHVRTFLSIYEWSFTRHRLPNPWFTILLPHFRHIQFGNSHDILPIDGQ